jgi:hypothetical protein
MDRIDRIKRNDERGMMNDELKQLSFIHHSLFIVPRFLHPVYPVHPCLNPPTASSRFGFVRDSRQEEKDGA